MSADTDFRFFTEIMKGRHGDGAWTEAVSALWTQDPVERRQKRDALLADGFPADQWILWSFLQKDFDAVAAFPPVSIDWTRGLSSNVRDQDSLLRRMVEGDDRAWLEWAQAHGLDVNIPLNKGPVNEYETDAATEDEGMLSFAIRESLPQTVAFLCDHLEQVDAGRIAEACLVHDIQDGVPVFAEAVRTRLLERLELETLVRANTRTPPEPFLCRWLRLQELHGDDLACSRNKDVYPLTAAVFARLETATATELRAIFGEAGALGWRMQDTALGGWVPEGDFLPVYGRIDERMRRGGFSIPLRRVAEVVAWHLRVPPFLEESESRALALWVGETLLAAGQSEEMDWDTWRGFLVDAFEAYRERIYLNTPPMGLAPLFSPAFSSLLESGARTHWESVGPMLLDTWSKMISKDRHPRPEGEPSAIDQFGLQLATLPAPDAVVRKSTPRL
jgi:hypothetical protein